MGKRDSKIDAYIEKCAPFAQPILEHLRELVHKACPEVEESVKWSMPFFDYKGPLCNMAAFKQHAVFGFWKGKLIKDTKGYLQDRAIDGGNSMGHLGRLTSIKDLPSDKVILDFIKQAKKLNDDGVKVASKPKPEIKELETPKDLIALLKTNKKAKATFDGFSYSNKKEYITWITEAKTEATRIKRLETAVEWMAEGKIRNWKYLKK
jgi:uncharacterized protein YdeI (YjbR/CyaY-like superfamily)